MQRILVLGAGFAGLWSAVGAARRLDELGVGPDRVEVLIINRTPWHSIRVRSYEADLEATRVPLAGVLDPVGVKHIIAQVTDIDIPGRKVTCAIDGSEIRTDHGLYEQTTIPAGEKLDINNVVIIPIGINNPSGGAEANQFSFELAYDSGTEERGNQQGRGLDCYFFFAATSLRILLGRGPESLDSVVWN